MVARFDGGLAQSVSVLATMTVKVTEYLISDPTVEVLFVNSEGTPVAYFHHFSGGPDYLATYELCFKTSPALVRAIYRIFNE